jgi:hypothetical protein
MKDGGLVIAPFGDDFGGQMQLDAVTLGDMQYFKLVNNVKNVFALTLEEAQDFVSGDVAKMQNRSRVFKNATRRKGVAGWNHDMEYALRHYLNYAARYIAMDTLKRDAVIDRIAVLIDIPYVPEFVERTARRSNRRDAARQAQELLRRHNQLQPVSSEIQERLVQPPESAGGRGRSAEPGVGR